MKLLLKEVEKNIKKRKKDKKEKKHKKTQKKGKKVNIHHREVAVRVNQRICTRLLIFLNCKSHLQVCLIRA